MTHRLVRRMWGENFNILAEKIAWVSKLVEVKQLGELEILPLYYNLDTDMFNRVVRITTDAEPRQVTDWVNEIEEKVNERKSELR